MLAPRLASTTNNAKEPISRMNTVMIEPAQNKRDYCQPKELEMSLNEQETLWTSFRNETADQIFNGRGSHGLTLNFPQ